MGTKPGYEFNQGNCEWIASRPDYDFELHGAPCQPLPDHPTSTISMVQTADQDVNLEMGERGSIYKVHLGDQDNQVLTLDAKRSCFTWECTDGLACSSTAQASGLFQIGQYSFKRNDIIITNDNGQRQIVDVWWDVTNTVARNSVAVKCYGATRSLSNVNVLSDQSLFASHQPLPGDTQSTSARTPVLTRLDVGYYEATNAAVGGFCKAGVYDEKETIFGAGRPDPFAKCQNDITLEQRDYTALEQEPRCRQLLEEYSCGSFSPARGQRSNGGDLQYYTRIMEKCVEELCDSFSYSTPNSQGYRAPPGTDKYQCKSDVYDFGVNFVKHLYGETFQADSTDCVPEVQVIVDGRTVPVDANGKVVLLLNEDYTCDSIPTNVVVKQKTCPNTCSGSTKLRATVEYQTGYEEVMRLFDEGNTVQLVVNGEPVDVSRFTGMGDQWCV